MNPFVVVVIVLVVAAVVINIAVAKGWKPKSAVGTSAEGVALKLASLVTTLKGEIALSYAGRQAVRTLMLFIMVCVETLPDGAEKDDCKKGAKAIDSAFFSIPKTAAPEVVAKTDPKTLTIT